MPPAETILSYTMSNGNKTDGRLSRRKMLAVALSGSAVGLAGCSGGTGNSGSSSNGSGGNGGKNQSGGSDQMAETVVDANVEFVPQDANWNHYSPGPYMSFFPWDYGFRKHWNGTTDYWLLKEDGFTYDADAKTVTYEFKPEYSYWWNGDPVTGEDYWMQREMERLFDPEGSPWKSWTMEDKYTVKGKRKKQLNPILKSTINQGQGRVFNYRGAFRKWLKRLQDASSTSERERIYQKLVEWEIPTEEFANKGLGNGTYQLTDWNTTEMVWKKFDKHPLADKAPFQKIRFRVGSGSKENQMITNGKLDTAVGQFPEELEKVSPDYLKTIYEKKSIQARNLLFNYNNKHIGRRNVRRALITILDFTRLRDFWSGPGGFLKKSQTGIPQTLEEKWLGKEVVNSMYSYPMKSDPKQASTFMERAGYTKKGGTWVGPDGDPLQFTLLTGEYKTSEELSQAMTQNWKQWGANPELLAVTNSQWTDKIFNPAGKWDIALFLHGFDSLTPTNYYDSVNPYHMRLGTSSTEIEQWLKEGKTHSPLNGRPLKLKIPKQPGLDITGSGQKINIYKLVEELKVTQSKQRSQEIIRTLATYFNYDLPMFDMFPQTAAAWGDTKNFNWPKDADIWYQKASKAEGLTWRKGLVKSA
jgi:peptide/nickel transport system substrate-binding protein